MSHTMRTFIGVPLTPTIRAKLVALQEDLAESSVAVKWVEPENLHVTMLFLGEVDSREVLTVCKTVEEVVAMMDPFSMRVAGVGCFPNLRRPRTIWAGIEQGSQELTELHDALEAPLMEQGCYRREDRAFTPHITLGRVRGESNTRALVEALSQQADWFAGQMTVTEIHVMSSELTKDGPAYTVMSRARLVRGEE
ncbi:MAG TPA: RNA 2',3'-cyclic phosphodiesterase [Gemmataceae bacterium]|jgi:2'-5' RNA ligase|nr:RNA 2',3'-cyclic phosphodiesterase [Gemmataceae bacterium]